MNYSEHNKRLCSFNQLNFSLAHTLAATPQWARTEKQITERELGRSLDCSLAKQYQKLSKYLQTTTTDEKVERS